MDKCLNSLDNEETNIDKISSAAHNFFIDIINQRRKKKKFDECQADGKTNYTFEQKNKKIGEMTRIIYD